MAMSGTSMKTVGASLVSKRLPPPPAPMPSLDEMLQGEESDEYTDSEEDEAEMSEADSDLTIDGTDFMMQAASHDSSDETDDDDDEYIDQPMTDAIIAKEVRNTSRTADAKKLVGISLGPARKPVPLPEINWDDERAADESDEYMETGDEGSDDERRQEVHGDLTVLLFGDGSASDAPGDEEETDAEDGDWPGPQGRRTRSREKALRVARAAINTVQA